MNWLRTVWHRLVLLVVRPGPRPTDTPAPAAIPAEPLPELHPILVPTLLLLPPPAPPEPILAAPPILAEGPAKIEIAPPVEELTLEEDEEEQALAEALVKRGIGNVAYKDERVADSGEFVFKKGCLDQLDKIFVYLRRMKKTDPNGYEFYRRVGARLVANKASSYLGQLDELWRSGARPAFGSLSFAEGKSSDNWIPGRFLYFTKIDRPPYYYEPAPPDTTVYCATIYYDDAERHRKIFRQGTGLSMTFYVAVSAKADQVTCLRRWAVGTDRIWSKRDRCYFSIPRKPTFTYPPILTDGLEDMKIKFKDRPLTPQQFGSEFFCIIANFAISGQAGMAQVRATKDGITAVFTIDIKRVPRFFSDRTIETDHKRKVFHIVRAHERHLKNGKTAVVHFHFRGERSFVWHGYDIVITVPGLHHRPEFSYEATAYERYGKETWPKPEEEMVDHLHLAKIVEKAQTGDRVSWRH